MFRLLFLEPGHFHAALLLRSPNPRIEPTGHFHAAPGPDPSVAVVERAPVIRDGVLALECNAEIRYRLGRHHVRQQTEWRRRTPPGGGDAHNATVWGSRAVVVSRQGPDTRHRPELHVGSDDRRSLAGRLEAGVEAWQTEWPGLEMVESDVGFELVMPPDQSGGHETHFAQVLDRFLDLVDRGEWPAADAAAIRTRYTLLAGARDFAS
ncbi:MAG: hypothetical protein GY929_26870 [Actinomycetia bacterium]|nr:hypothetical protein [Actinomycetes bacterium]